MKTCSSCGETKPLDAFARRAASKTDGRQVWCKACKNAYKTVWHRANPEKVAAARLWTRHRMRPIDLEHFLAEQDYLCRICSKELGTDFHIDHDHACHPEGSSCLRCRRGILCPSCNFLVGQYEKMLATGVLGPIQDYVGR